MRAVCDAGPLIHLDELGCLDLLADFAEVIVPVGVWEETIKHRGHNFLLQCQKVAAPNSRCWLWEHFNNLNFLLVSIRFQR